jgi:hypothetical protein
MALKLDKYTSFEKADNGENIDVFYTSDMKDELELFEKMTLNVFSRKIAKKFLNINSSYRKIIGNFTNKNNLENIAILAAHTKKIKGNWFYFNEDAGSPIQEWIDTVDGHYKCLIIYSCNPEKNELSSEKSPIFTFSKFI